MAELNDATVIQTPTARRALYMAGFVLLVALCAFLGVTADTVAEYVSALAPALPALTSLLAALNVGEEVEVVGEDDDSYEDPEPAGGDDLEEVEAEDEVDFLAEDELDLLDEEDDGQ